jgi:hypothetical protein
MSKELISSILTRNGWFTEGGFKDPNPGIDLDYHSHVGLFTVLLGIS